ncbi:MAG: transcriptional regulator, AraC family [Holophagaceae bacterium]|nr:transcriptional regulator, AraC family [Holophagaceae bacterium]
MDIEAFERQLHELTPFEMRCRQIVNGPNRQEGMAEFKAILDTYATTHEDNFPDIPVRIKVTPGFVTLMDSADISVAKQLRYAPDFEHTHGFIELLYVYQGHCRLRSNSGERLLKEGDLCIVSPETFHAHDLEDDSDIVIYAMFRRDSFDAVFHSLLSGSTAVSDFLVGTVYGAEADQNILFHTGKDSALKKTVLRLYYECEQAMPLRDAMMQNLLNTLMLLLVRDHSGHAEVIQAGRTRESNPMSPIISYVYAHYRTVTLQELATRFNHSPSRLSEMFKRHVGKTFNTFIRELRVNKAARLIKGTAIKLSDIAAHLGYADTSHLNKEFRHFFNVTPGEYRLPPRKPPETSR